MSKWTIDVKEDDEGLFIELPDALIEETGWKIGDNIKWTDNGDGSFTMTKQENTKIVLVDAISTFRMRYAVELKSDSPDEWALDTVVCGDAKEFSQEHLGEQIVSHRVVSREEFLEVFDKDNDYLKAIETERKFEIGLTELKDSE